MDKNNTEMKVMENKEISCYLSYHLLEVGRG